MGAYGNGGRGLRRGYPACEVFAAFLTPLGTPESEKWWQLTVNVPIR